MYERIVFIDFDGTVTSEETLDNAMRLLVSDYVYNEKHKEVMEGRISLSQALHSLFDNTPSSRLNEILEYIKTVKIRDGFGEFLDEMIKLDIPVVLVSGGLRQMLEAKIDIYKDKLLDIYCVELETDGENMKLVSEYEDGNELMVKTAIMAKYEYKQSICIGDGYTDINMAEASDIIFARDVLAEYLKRKGKKYFPWNDFYDIISIINSR